MLRLCVQGDILVERVDDALISGPIIYAADGAVVIAEGELTGHHHKLVGCVTLYRDETLAQDIPENLYIGHVQVKGHSGRLEHEEHAPINLERGTYRVRRQRQLEPSDVGLAGD
jgi:hypothetical protein